jgi:hypothetical protein
MLRKICFVIGPIGSPGHEIRLAADDFITYIVAPCIRELGYDEPRRADLLPEPGRITAQIIELLNSADLVIADLTGGNENVYYELSCRHAIGKPVIHMALEGTRLPFDVFDNRTIFYTMHAREVEIARQKLKGQIERTHEPGYRARNPILDAIGLITLERSVEPTQQLLAQLTREMESLRGDMGDLRSRLTLQPVPGLPGLGLGQLGYVGSPILLGRSFDEAPPGAGRTAEFLAAASASARQRMEVYDRAMMRDAAEQRPAAKNDTSASDPDEPKKP